MKYMNLNMGKYDKAIRLVLGFGIVGAGLAFSSWWGLLGLILIATASMGTCPLYLPFGIKTKRSG